MTLFVCFFSICNYISVVSILDIVGITLVGTSLIALFRRFGVYRCVHPAVFGVWRGGFGRHVRCWAILPMVVCQEPQVVLHEGQHYQVYQKYKKEDSCGQGACGDINAPRDYQ